MCACACVYVCVCVKRDSVYVCVCVCMCTCVGVCALMMPSTGSADAWSDVLSVRTYVCMYVHTCSEINM